jgi:uncharacterized delta-60 repeat protein
VAGYDFVAAYDMAKLAIARYKQNGSLDSCFSGDGRQLTAFPGGGGFDAGNAVAIQRNARIVVAGYAAPSASSKGKFALARYKPNGSLDSSFSGDGRQLTAFPGGHDRGSAVAIQKDGKIVVAGTHLASPTYRFAIARYGPNGSLDPSFSGDGRQLTAFPGTQGEDRGNAVAIQKDGKILVAGFSLQNQGSEFALARYSGG